MLRSNIYFMPKVVSNVKMFINSTIGPNFAMFRKHKTYISRTMGDQWSFEAVFLKLRLIVGIPVLLFYEQPY
jgi:hypothetical protein